jgi:hypothetical protein
MTRIRSAIGENAAGHDSKTVAWRREGQGRRTDLDSNTISDTSKRPTRSNARLRETNMALAGNERDLNCGRFDIPLTGGPEESRTSQTFPKPFPRANRLTPGYPAQTRTVHAFARSNLTGCLRRKRVLLRRTGFLQPTGFLRRNWFPPGIERVLLSQAGFPPEDWFWNQRVVSRRNGWLGYRKVALYFVFRASV